MLKTSRATHVTEFPSKLTGEWMDGIYCHTLTNSEAHLTILVHWGVNHHPVDKTGE